MMMTRYSIIFMSKHVVLHMLYSQMAYLALLTTPVDNTIYVSHTFWRQYPSMPRTDYITSHQLLIKTMHKCFTEVMKVDGNVLSYKGC